MKKMTALFLSFLMILCSCAYAESEECEHLDFYVESDLHDGAVYTVVDEFLHHVVGETTEYKVCFECGERTGGETYTVDEDEYHSYDFEGVCSACGRVCDHPSSNTFEDRRDLQFAASGAEGHTVTCRLYDVVCCDICGAYLKETLTNEAFSYEEPHYFSDGFCTDCNMENPCAHENVESYDSYEYDALPLNDKEHLLDGSRFSEKYCVDCGEYLGRELVDDEYQETEPHYFGEGVCYQCGAENTCAHEESEIWEDYYPLEFTIKNAFYHTVRSEQYNVYHCTSCGEDFARELASSDYTSDSEHWFWEGECLECGYVDDQPERVRFVGGVVSGVSMLASFAESSGASAWLLYPKAILTEEELIAFDNLNTSENWLSAQALTILTAIGYDDAVQAALNNGLITLTEAESALITAVSERIAAMDAAELASFEQVLNEFFPVERVTDDGESMRTLSLTVSAPENGGAMTEVYTLLYNEEFGEWSFEMTEAG